jgi:spore germination protein KA
MEENAHTRNSGGTAMENHDTFGSAKLPSEQLEPNLKYILNLFQGDDTLRHRFITNKGKQEHKFCIIYADGMVDSKLMSDNIVRPLMQYKFPENCNDLVGTVQESVISVNSAERTQDVEKIVQAIVYGDSALLLDGSADVLILDTKGWSKRAIEEPESERVLRGPREGFNEALLENISMIRRRLRTPDLKLNMLTFGRRTRTKACLCYLDSLVDKRVLEALKSRLSKIDIDGTLDTQYIAELVRDKPYAGIDTVGSTERPDVAVAKMLEGRIVLILDGSPQVMTVPFLLIEAFQSDEDYYLSYLFSSIGRILRIFAFYVSISLPSLYIAAVTYHPEILPFPLLVSIAQARQGVPFPTILELVMMLIVFELLRESGGRMPGNMGQTLSIVGALVIGQAAVEAKIVSAPIIIIVATTGITGLMNQKIKGFDIAARFLMLATTSVLGLYGFLFANVALLALLYQTDSFGVPILGRMRLTKIQGYKDTYMRAPWWLMLKRPKELTKNVTRQKRSGAAK